MTQSLTQSDVGVGTLGARDTGSEWRLALAAFLFPCVLFWAYRLSGGGGRLTLTLLLVGILGVSTTLTDFQAGKIRNCWTIPAIGFGLLLNSAFPALSASRVGGDWVAVLIGHSGAVGWQSSCAGLGVCFGLTLLVFLAKGCGGGDVKLAGAYGSLLGLIQGFEAVLWAHVVAAVFVCILGVWCEGLSFIRRLTRLMIRSVSFGRVFVEKDSFELIQGGRIRMAGCYAVGVIIALVDPLSWTIVSET